MVTREGRRVSDGELPVLGILNGDSMRPAAGAQMGRSVKSRPSAASETAGYWSGRNFAGRNSARLAA